VADNEDCNEACERHLQETLVQMKAGAHALIIPEPMAERMKDRYRTDYKNPANIESWEKGDGLKILVLSRVVGEMAEFFTRVKAILHGQPVGTDIDDHCLYLAGLLMSRSLCPPPGTTRILGRHCENYPVNVGLAIRLLLWALGLLVRWSGLRVTAGPLTAR